MHSYLHPAVTIPPDTTVTGKVTVTYDNSGCFFNSKPRGFSSLLPNGRRRLVDVF